MKYILRTIFTDVYVLVYSESKENVIFATTRHGGHLGYFEGGLVIPETITWLDKIVVEYANAAFKTYAPKVPAGASGE